MTLAWVFLGLGMLLILEGLAYALAPSLIERMLEVLRSTSVEMRRLIGFLAITIGCIFVLLAVWIGV